jgi:hypothetical protein
MKPQLKSIALLMAITAMLFASCSKDAIDALPGIKDTITKQHGIPNNNAIEDTVLTGTGYQARIINGPNETVKVYYNTTGFTLTWTHISKGLWYATVDNQDAIIELHMQVDPASKGIDKATTDYTYGDGFYVRTYKNGKPCDNGDVWVHYDIYTIDNPPPTPVDE